MAQQARPFAQQVGALRAYFPIDFNDQNLYNSFTFQYERYAFFEMLDKIADGSIKHRPGNGNEVVTLWKQRKSALIAKAKSKSKNPKPDPIAQPPPAVAPQGKDPGNADDAGAQISPSSPGAEASPTPPAPESICSSDAELSPRFVFNNRPDAEVKVLLSPTKGERTKIKEDLKRTSDLNWRFATTLYQLPIPEDPVSVMPPTSAYLFVGLDTEGIIRDRAVAKLVDVKKLEGYEIKADESDEVKTHQALAPIHCSHLQQWRGVEVRHINLKTATDDDAEGDEVRQVAMHLYTDFAARGDLQELCKAHYETKRPIPEHFIWYTLKCVVEGIIAMRDGTCESPRQTPVATVPDPSNYPRKSILHLDLKSANIFLEDKNGTATGFPAPILGDFGSAQTLPLPPKYSRENGTDGWLPPERNPNDKGANQAKPYVPRHWPIDERSELYSVGLIALSLTKAHKLTMAQQEFETKSLAEAWFESMSHEGSELDGGRGPSSLNELEPQYSVHLYQTLARCLMTRPDDRYSLDELKKIINLERLRIDRRYGDELKRSHDEMDDDFAVQLTKEQKDSRGFTLATRFSPAKKRRKVNLDELSDELRTQIADLVRDWNDPDDYAKLTKHELMPMIEDLKNRAEGGMSLDENTPEYVAMRYFISTLCKYVSKSIPAYVYWKQDWKFEFADPLSIGHRRFVLEHILDDVIPALEQSQSNTLDAVRILEHAIEWGIMLITADGEPRESKLIEPSVLHLAVHQFVFKTPTGAFGHEEMGSSEESVDPGQNDDLYDYT
ncbi:kinase-like domain-containing protein [Phaeosphaeria sp. MPI-PUGE-AT-0046c]|nr:kinase-like domain-containing protein [Phaeosphaeria sp. MPI-PUGE-AT-0046c]